MSEGKIKSGLPPNLWWTAPAWSGRAKSR